MGYWGRYWQDVFEREVKALKTILHDRDDHVIVVESGVTWTTNKIKKVFTVKKSLNSLKISEFSYISRINQWNKFHFPRTFTKLKNDPMVIYYVLNILFLLNFDIFLGPFFFFCLFFLQKDLDIFCMLLSRVFSCVFDNSYLSFYLFKNLWKIFFICFKNYLCYVIILWKT